MGKGDWAFERPPFAQRFQTGLRHPEASFRAEYPEAENTLGWMYHRGKGVPPDPKLAFELYKKAAFGGEPSAAGNLGDVYSIGSLGQTVDKPLARKWYEEGAAKGNEHCGMCMAWDCIHGEGGLVDRKKALQALYSVTDVNQSRQAQSYLALLYSTEGEGVPQNRMLALMWGLLCGNEVKWMAKLTAELTGKMTSEEIARAVAASEECRRIQKAGGFVILPERLTEQKVVYAPHPDWNPWIRIRRQETDIIVPLTINGQGPFDFVLDSGCTGSLIDGKLAARIGLEEVGQCHLASLGSSPVVMGDGICLGNALFHATFVEQSMESFSRASFHPIAGILGYDFLRRFVVEVDYGARKIRLSDPEDFAYAGAGKPVSLRFNQGLPYLAGSLRTLAVEPLSSSFLVDTGSGGSVDCYGSFGRRFDFPSLVPKTIYCLAARTLYGDDTGMMGRFQAFSCGEFTIPSPVASCLPGSNIAGGTSGLAIGGEILSRFNAVFDYKRSQMFLEPTERLSENHPSYRIGIAVEGAGDDYHTPRVFHLDPDSPGDRAGVKVDDEIVEWNGAKAEAFFKDDGNEDLSPRKENKLTVRRGDQTLSFTLAGDEY